MKMFWRVMYRFWRSVKSSAHTLYAFASQAEYSAYKRSGGRRVQREIDWQKYFGWLTSLVKGWTASLVKVVSK
jgi:hypothetical protein